MHAASNTDRIVFNAIASALPGRHLRRVIVEPYSNAVDEEGLRIRAVLADEDPAPISGDAHLRTLLALSDQLGAAGDARMPTLYFATEDELAHLDDPDT